MEHAEVKVDTLPVKRWMEEYCTPEKFAGSCEACPDYGKVWSCPPGLPDAKALFIPFSRVHIIGMKVVYKKETRAAAVTWEKADRLGIVPIGTLIEPSKLKACRRMAEAIRLCVFMPATA